MAAEQPNAAGLPAAPGALVAEAVIYKTTRFTDVVVQRRVRLYADRLQTQHDDARGDAAERTWALDRGCRLDPESPEDIARHQRTVRPPGTWTVTAAATAKGQPMDLYGFTIQWPSGWLTTKAYSSCGLCFVTKEEAVQWHGLVSRQLQALRARAPSSCARSDGASMHSASHHSRVPSAETEDAAAAGGPPLAATASAPAVSGGLLPGGILPSVLRRRRAAESPATSTPETWMAAQQTASPDSAAAAAAAGGGAGLAGYWGEGAPADDGGYGGAAYDDDADSWTETEGSGSEEEGAVDDGGGPAGGDAGAPRQTVARWVPYRHTNGVAIYRHPEEGEYMASSIVKGTPEECLAVLMDVGSHVTILGPASDIELLEGTTEERQVLRIVVEATGMARRLCAPREAIVERVSQAEDSGVTVVLFSSMEEGDAAAGGPPPSPMPRGAAAPAAAAAAPAAARRPWRGAGVIGALAAALCLLFGWIPALLLRCIGRGGGGGAGAPAGRRGAAALGRRRGGGWWKRPVVAHVRGGYTISPRESPADGQTPECLVTCILKVDLGGVCGERSWLRPIADAIGWVDAYVERMLMAVILVKDEIEQRRFLVQPFMMLSGDGAAGGGRGRRLRRRRRYGGGAVVHGEEGAPLLGEGECGSVGAGGTAGSARDGSPARTTLARSSSVASPPAAAPAGRLAKMASRMRRVWGRGKAPKQQQQPQQPRPPSQRGGFISSAISLLPFGGGGGGHPPPSRTTTPVPTSTIRSSERGSGLFAAALSLTPFGGSSGAGAAAAAAIARASLAASLGEASGAGGHVAGGAEEDARAGDSGAGEGGELDAAAAAEQEMRDWYQGGPNGPAAKLAKLPPQYWGELHVPGTAAPFKVRGASYLADRLKVDAGVPQFVLAAVDLVAVDGPTQHISRFLPSVRENPAAFSFVVNLIIPGTPILSLVSVFINEHHPSILGERPEPGTSDCDWQPFDFALHRFLNGTDAERTSMLKLIPHLPNASWVIKQSVGTVPVILGNKLKTTFYRTDRYIEATVDVTSTNAAAYITGMVRGATKSLIIDLGYVLEGQTEEELPEVLLGAFRLSYMDIGEAQYLDTSKELPMPEARPAPPSPVKRPGQPAAPGASMVAARVSMDGGREEQQRRQQQQQQQQGEVEACGGVSEGEAGPKTMTSHARNRSNTSVEELLGPSAGVLTAKQQQQQQQQQQARAGVPTADGPSHHSAALRSQQPSRGSTYEGQPVAAAAAAAAAGGDAGSSAHGSRRPSSGGAGGLLGTSPRGGGAAAAAAPAAAPPTLRPLGSVPLAVGAAASPSVPGSGGAAPPGGHRRTISDFVPRSAAAAFAGVLGGPGGSAPLSASPSLACARQSSDGQAAPAAAATTAAAAGKLSAADYITRAHAVAMATSAQRRGSAGGGRGGGATAAGGPLQAAASGPLAGASPVPQLAPSASTPAPAAVGSKAPAASAGKERRSGLPGIPQASWSADGEATVGPAGGAAAGKGGWRHKRNASGVA